MAKSDIAIKGLMQHSTQDWIKLLFSDVEVMEIQEIETDKVPAKKESRMDKLVKVETKKENLLIHMEAQAYHDRAMAARMLRYRADIWESYLNKNNELPSIKQTVIYLYENKFVKRNELKDTWGDTITIDYKYNVIKVWELDRKRIIKEKLVGLYPLIPLMKEDGESKEKILKETVEVIETVQDEVIKGDLLAVTSILSEDKYSPELIKSFIRREQLMQSSVFDEWVREEREETEIKTIKKMILEQLREKFGFFPKDIKQDIEEINDKDTLSVISRKMVIIETIEELERLLYKAKNLN